MTKEEAIKHLMNDWFKMLNGQVCVEYDRSEPFLEALGMAIAALREQVSLEKKASDEKQATSEWISVDARLPEPFVSVLVYMPGERPLPTVHEGYIATDGKWYAHFFSRDPGEVTHWMPMPEAQEVEV